MKEPAGKPQGTVVKGDGGKPLGTVAKGDRGENRRALW